MTIDKSKSVGRKRLMALADFLYDKAPELKGKFTMKRWGGNGLNEDSTPMPFVAGSCGTVACALGWGTAVPMLREAGLRAFVQPWSKTVFMALVDERDEIVEEGSYGAASVHGLVSRLFGVNSDRSDYMFAPTSSDGDTMRLSAKQAATRICNTIRQIDADEGWLV